MYDYALCVCVSVFSVVHVQRSCSLSRAQQTPFVHYFPHLIFHILFTNTYSYAHRIHASLLHVGISCDAVFSLVSLMHFASLPSHHFSQEEKHQTSLKLCFPYFAITICYCWCCCYNFNCCCWFRSLKVVVFSGCYTHYCLLAQLLNNF